MQTDFIIFDLFQGLDGEATEPMIKELEEEREEFQDPEVEFAIAGAVREYGGLEIILNMIQVDKLFLPESPALPLDEIFISLIIFSQISVYLYIVCVFFVPIIPVLLVFKLSLMDAYLVLKM